MSLGIRYFPLAHLLTCLFLLFLLGFLLAFFLALRPSLGFAPFLLHLADALEARTRFCRRGADTFEKPAQQQPGRAPAEGRKKRPGVVVALVRHWHETVGVEGFRRFQCGDRI